jgi:hypothetical protein
MGRGPALGICDLARGIYIRCWWHNTGRFTISIEQTQIDKSVTLNTLVSVTWAVEKWPWPTLIGLNYFSEEWRQNQNNKVWLDKWVPPHHRWLCSIQSYGRKERKDASNASAKDASISWKDSSIKIERHGSPERKRKPWSFIHQFHPLFIIYAGLIIRPLLPSITSPIMLSGIYGKAYR